MLLKAPRQWVASPIGFNLIISLLKENNAKVEKFKQLATVLESTGGYSYKRKLFVSSAHQAKESIKNFVNNIEVQETDFSKSGNDLIDWVNKNANLKNVDLQSELTSQTEFVVANSCVFERGWEVIAKSGPLMKLYNSFNYTLDVKYEGRLLVLPLRSDFKLVIVIPNETDVLHTLFATLEGQGLTAAVKNIHPLFTATFELNAPKIEVSSKIQIQEKIKSLRSGSVYQYGDISVNMKGTRVNVLTCAYSLASPPTVKEEKPKEPPFYFAVIFNDIAIFTGQFAKKH